MTTGMVRKYILIKKQQEELLKRLAKARGKSQSEIIRQALDNELRKDAQKISNEISPIDAFALLALSKRQVNTEKSPLIWHRADLYSDREDRWLRESEE